MQESTSTISSIEDVLAGTTIDGWAARILALVGQRDLAIQEIERLIDTLGYTLTRWNLTLDPRWDFFRDDERFNDLVHPVNDP